MKRKNDYQLLKVGIQNIVVRESQEEDGPEGMIWLNETGVFLWEQLKEDITTEELAKRLADEYGISPDVVRGDVDAFLEQLKNGNVLEACE